MNKFLVTLMILSLLLASQMPLSVHAADCSPGVPCTDGDDVYTGDENDNVCEGLGGDDIISGGAGDDIIDGGPGSDTFSERTASVDMTVDLTQQGTPQDTALGHDTLISIENVFTGEGNDVIIGDDNANILDGGAGDDFVSAGLGNDVLIGGTGNDILSGGFGDDTLYGGEGDDILCTGSCMGIADVNEALVLLNPISYGVDQLFGGDEDDLLWITGNNGGGPGAETYITGGSGNNIFRFGWNVSGYLILESLGTDTLDFSSLGEVSQDQAGGSDSSGIRLDLGLTGVVQEVRPGLFLTLKGLFTNLIGTVFADVLKGNSLDNHIDANFGDDTIYTSEGADIINGGGGNDVVWYAQADDVYSSIEQFLPEELEQRNPLDTSDPLAPLSSPSTGVAPAVIIAVTGSGLLPLACGVDNTFLMIDNGALVFLPSFEPCGAQIGLATETLQTLPASLPQGYNFVSAVSVTLVQDGQALDTLPTGVTLRVTFAEPQVQGTLVVLFWDGMQWQELSADGLMATSNQTGVFVLASR